MDQGEQHQATTSLPHRHELRQQPRSGSEVIIGVDTHKDIHVVAVLSPTGALLDTASFSTTLAGSQELLKWVRGHGEPTVAGVEGTGSWGAGLTQVLRREGIAVIEVNRTDRSMRRQRGKTDTVDAEAAARAVLSGQATVTPKSHDGMVEVMRLYKLAKDSAVKARTQAINQLKGVLVNGDPLLREQLAGKTTHAQVMHCLTLTCDGLDTVRAASHPTLRTLAERIRHLSSEIRELEKLLTAAVAETAPRPPGPLWRRPRQRRRPTHRCRRQSGPADRRGILRRPLRRQPS
ncbi:transposase [Micromonospora sp. NPDC047707]|uniref:IS110 family transposase n=1 Tax=Micromonospora sp. NPDC047707 TaxID=3154498 RepID=UPI0034532750